MPNSGRGSSAGSRLERLQRLLGMKERRRVFKRRLMMESLETRRVLANIEVTSLLDTTDGSDGVTTLREAIVTANEALGADTITFAPTLSGSIVLTQGELIITESVHVTGAVDTSATPGAEVITIDADKKSRVLNIQGTPTNPVDVSIQGLKLTNGLETTNVGGGILFASPGELNLTDTTVSGSRTTSKNGFGGGIYTNMGQITLLRSVVTGNRALGNGAQGGGIHSNSGSLTLTDSLVSYNYTVGQYASGGGIMTKTGTITLDRSKVTHNATYGDRSPGGGILSDSGNITLTSSTVSGNKTDGLDSQGGGISSSAGTISLTASTVANNSTFDTSSPGGGLRTFSGDISLMNSTISGNVTMGSMSPGGGLSSYRGDVSIISSTVAFNKTYSSPGGGVFVNFDASILIADGERGSLTIQNSIIAQNSVTPGDDGPDLFAANFTPANPTAVIVAQSSLIGNGVDTPLLEAPVGSPDGNGNIIGTTLDVIDPMLGELGIHGGLTSTHALKAGSPAINAGNAALALTLTNDQRGAPFSRTSGPIDMGAYERHVLTIPSPLVVTTLDDEYDLDPLSNLSDLSLREAMGLANSSEGANTIVFDSQLSGYIYLSPVLGQLQITDSVTITGNGAFSTTIDAKQQGFRVIDVIKGSIDVSISGITLQNGQLWEEGGGIRFQSSGNLSLSDSTLYQNESFSSGGGIFNSGTLTITNSVLINNQGSVGGGGIFNSGTATITSSTLWANRTASLGGGIHNVGTATITNSTLSSNHGSSGGGIYNVGTATITNSTLATNFGSTGGGIFNSGTATLNNTIVVSDYSSDISGTVVGRNNLIGAPSSSGGLTDGTDGNIVGIGGADLAEDQVFEFLSSNGGPTPTHALVYGSPAINAGDSSLATSLTTDQRGVGFDRIIGNKIDIGAYETKGLTLTSLVSSLNPSTPGELVTFTATVTADPIFGVPTGSVNFFLDGLSDTPAVPLVAGSASITYSTLNIGRRTVWAYYTGDTNFSSSRGELTQTVTTSLSINDVTVTEGNSGTVNANFTVSLSGASTDPVSVNYTTANGTATQPSDYNSATGTLTFAPGETSKTITIPVIGDLLDEANDTFSVILSSPVNASIADATGIGTITDDDASPTVTLSSNNATIAEASGTATFIATLSEISGRAVTVNLGFTGTATLLGDYIGSSTQIVIPAGQTTGTVTVIAEQDTLDETDETIIVDVSSVTNGTEATAQQATVTITDDDTPPTVTLSRNNATMLEAAGNSTFTATLSAASGLPVTVDLGFAGTATLTNDYTRSATQIMVPAGQLSGTVTITAVQDTLDETDETIIVDITGVTNGTEATSQQASVTITDDDAAPTLSINDVTVTEGNTGTANATFTVTLSAASYQTITVNYATTNGTAVQPGDYTSSTGTLTFAPGETTKSITVPVLGDLLDEANETFNVNLSTPVNATIADGAGVGTITDDDASPTLSINDVTVSEGNAGTVNATFTVTLSETSGQTVAVSYATSDGTAVQTADFISIAGMLVFAAGETTKSITVPIVGDLVDEIDEAFHVNLSTPVSATIADGIGVGTITDDDVPPTISISDAEVIEGNTGTVNATFTVTLSAASGQAVTVNYAMSNGTAIQPGDYVTTTGTLTFAPGQTSETIVVAVMSDTLDETNESFNFHLSTPVNATIADGTGVGTITDDDANPTLSINDVTVTEGNAGTVNATFTITLSAVSGQEVKVNYVTANGTAIQPVDFISTSGTLTFAPGETSKTLTVAVQPDFLDEANETFVVNLSTPVNASIADGIGVGTITDDDATPTLSINDVTVTEGNTGTVNATFTVTLSAASGQTVTVNYVTANGTAVQPADYIPSTGTLTFAPGETTKTFTVAVNGDSLDEVNETFAINLSSPVNATIADGNGVGTITDDDLAPTLSINDIAVTEGNAGTANATFTIMLSAASGQAVTVTYATADSTAIQPADYASSTGTLFFAPGETTKTITVAVNGDTFDEINEVFNVHLATPVNATIADGMGVGTITDDDAAPTLSINDVTVTEVNTGTVNATFTVTLSAASSQQVTVNFATADNTAIQPADYTSSTGTLTFAPGEITKTITVAVKGDTVDEINEVFNVSLMVPVNATIADGIGVGTITDDDAAPTLSINDVTVTEGNTGTVNATFTVTLSAASSQQVTVNFATADNTAIQPADYTSSTGTLTFAPGEITKTITVAVKGDMVDEINEVFNVSLMVPVNATIADGIGVGTITDDDAAPTLSINDVTVTEGNTGTVNATFMVTLSAASSQHVTVNFATADNTAIQPADYISSTGAMTFAPGETSKAITVSVKGDALDEASETFNVTLASPTNATIADGTGIGTITDDDASPTLSINDVTVAEGNTSTINATFTVTLSAVSGQAITVNYATADISAIQPSDYTTSIGTITFAPGETSKTITVSVKGDALDEVSETFNVTLASPTNSTIADGTGIGTITDDDASPTLSINDVTVAEGNTGAVNATFTVTMSAVSGQAITVNYATADISAIQPSDYTTSIGTITFAPGETSKTITVSVKGDALDEVSETFNVTLASPTNATLADGTGIGTITDDDASPTLSINDVTLAEGNTSTINATFTVTMSAVSGQAVTVNYATTDISAIQPSDYTTSIGTITFAPGETSKTITVSVKGDALDEVSETFNVTLASPTNATLADGTGIGTITDDDASPTLSINDVTVAEGNTGTINATFTVTLSAVSGQAITVNYATTDGTAIQPSDYTTSPGTITFAPGETSKTITVVVKGDTLDEVSETFNVTLASPTNATLADGTGIGTISDDDASPTLSINDVTLAEGNTGAVNATFTVTMSAVSGQAVTVNYATADGTAIQPSDYTTSPGTITFAPGETSKTITVVVKGDTLDEVSETFNVTLASPTNATLADGTGIGTISDDDASPTLSINDVTATEGNTGTVNATFTVTLSAASGQAVTVNYATANGTAVQPNDYASSSGTLSFAPGETTKTITVAIHGDVLDEVSEAFNVNLSTPVNATIGDGIGLGTITDDDAAPTLSIGDVTVTEGNSGTVNAAFTVTLSAASSQSISVDYATANDSAVEPSDFKSPSGKLTFAPGETTKTILIAVAGDTLDEINETFNVNLSAPLNATIADGLGVGTINDDDAAPTLSVNDIIVTEGNSATLNATFTVTLSAVSGQAVTVNYATANGSAVEPNDFASSTGTLTFAPGEITKTILVAVKGDVLDEVNESFNVNLSTPVNATIADGVGLGTLTDDDASPTLTINDVTVIEGNTGTVNATFTVTLSAESGQAVTVNYATANGTAIQPADYASNIGTLTFAPGETTKTFTVVVNGDTLDEINEAFNVNLSTPVNATIADGTGVGTITDDDASPTLTINDMTVTEGNTGTVNATFTVMLSAESGQAVTVNYATASGTAVQPDDYASSSGTLFFASGETTKTITVVVKGDALDELNESFSVSLSTPMNATIADGIGVGTITDDDATPTLSINDVTVTEGDTGTVDATFTVTLSTASGQTISVNYATTAGTAAQTSDYAAVSGAMTFAPGETTKTIKVTVASDQLDETNETFNVNLSAPLNATLADGVGVGTITDNDPAPAVTLSRNVAEIAEPSDSATFTATLSAASSLPVTVTLAFTGTATFNSDYISTDFQIVIQPGQTTGSVSVSAVADTLDEFNETIIVDVSSVTNAIVATQQQATVILNDDGPRLLVVNTAIDELNFNNTAVSLREAIQVANRRSDLSTITFDPNLVAPIVLTLGELVVTESLVISGRGVKRTVIDGNARSRVINVTGSAADVTFNDLTIQYGFVDLQNAGGSAGAGIRFASSGTLSLVNTSILFNEIASNLQTATGGGIYANAGPVSIVNSTISGNSAANGGGVYASAALNVTGSAFISNNAKIGGAIFAQSTSSVTNSTISDNLASSDSGAIKSTGDFTLTHSTVVDNRSSLNTGGIDSTNLTILNSILANNSDTRGTPNLRRTPQTIRFSLVDNLQGTSLPASPVTAPDKVGNRVFTAGANGNFIGSPSMRIDPKLGDLEFNGGPTMTHELLPGSLAINAGDPAIVTTLTNDQRGMPFVRKDGRIDMGAVESQTLSPSLFIVNTATDELDFNNAQVSLREALTLANLESNVDNITFATSVTAPINLSLGALSITNPVNITGIDNRPIVIDAGQKSRVFELSETAGDVSMSLLTIRNGKTTLADQDGGGIYSASSGKLTLRSSTIAGNSVANTPAEKGLPAVSSFGGGISAANVLLVNSTLTGNSAAGGGAIDGANVVLINSTISGNTANGGAAISADSVSLTNSTVTLNTSTLANTGAIAVGNAIIKNSIVSANTAALSSRSSDVVATAATINYSLIGSMQVAFLDTQASGNNQFVTNPILGPLQANGGVVSTHAPLANSPAINRGSNLLAIDDLGNSLITDQRGGGFARIIGSSVDIGAVETGTQPTFDFGDAPASFPVLLLNDGARHAIGALKLGATLSAEANGQVSATATGDTSGDDGVIILASLVAVAGATTTSSVSVIASGPGKLDAWIDFNRDGDWNDEGEQILDSAAIVQGDNLVSFNVPAAGTSPLGGGTFARFRFSSVGNLAPGGAAADGEVEDYAVMLVPGSATAALDIEIPGGDSNISIEGDSLIVRNGSTIVSKVPFASFGTLKLNGSDIDDILQLTILEALALHTLEFDGGLGTDFLELLEAGQTLDLTNADVTVRDIEGIDITGTGNNKLVISIDAVKEASSTTDTLEVVSNAGDTITFGTGWKAETPKFINGELTHIISEAATGGTARVEIRNNRPLTNPLTPFDADRDGKIQPLDALRIINELSRRGPGAFAIPKNDSEISRLYFDVSGDMQFTALDALRVINAVARINRGQTGSGEPSSAFAAPPLAAAAVAIDDVDSTVSPVQLLVQSKSLAVVQPAAASSAAYQAIDELFFDYGSDDEDSDNEAVETLLASLQ